MDGSAAKKENVALFRSQRFEKEARESVKSREKGF